MKKYKVELTESQKYIVDVLAKNEYDAKIKATKKWNKIVKSGIDHYNEVGDKEIEISYIYDVTNTDDPFDAENDEELSECEKQILDKEGEEALKDYQENNKKTEDKFIEFFGKNEAELLDSLEQSEYYD